MNNETEKRDLVVHIQINIKIWKKKKKRKKEKRIKDPEKSENEKMLHEVSDLSVWSVKLFSLLHGWQRLRTQSGLILSSINCDQFQIGAPIYGGAKWRGGLYHAKQKQPKIFLFPPSSFPIW